MSHLVYITLSDETDGVTLSRLDCISRIYGNKMVYIDANNDSVVYRFLHLVIFIKTYQYLIGFKHNYQNWICVRRLDVYMGVLSYQ